MKYHNKNTLCLTHDELVPVIMPMGTFKSLKARQQATVHGRGGNGNEILIEYETLPAKYKEEIITKYGNPYEYITKQPILDHIAINWDRKAEEFYTRYVLANGSKLPESYVGKYSSAATWLNAIGHFTSDKKALKNAFNISIAAFWTMAGSMVRTHDIGLPINDRKLKDKLTSYKAKGYDSLVDTWRFGNGNSKKVKDPTAEALLMRMIAHPHKHDDTIIAAEYNKWASKNERDAITPQTVGYWRREKSHLVTLSRDGASASYTKYSKQILGARPSAPLMLINSDDNVLDLFFKHEAKNGKGKLVKNDFYRPVAYIITDGFNDYILGYAIGDTVTIDLVKQAYLNAIHHVMELTGDCYLWQQIQTDHWSIDPKGKGELAMFFKNQATFTPASVKVAQSKYIERSFGVTWHQQLKFFPNYSGQNITAKEKLNPDALQLARKDFPNKDRAPEVVATFITRMRHTTNPKTGKPRQQEWVEAFRASEKSKIKLIDTEKRLQLFGVTHNYSNRITSSGIRVQINNQEHYYEVPDALYLENVNKQVKITYDPYDMSNVLVSDGKGLRFVANEFERMPRAIADFKEDTGKRLAAALQFKKEIPAFINSVMDGYSETLERADIDANSILQAGVTVKGINHKAQKRLTGDVADEVLVLAPARKELRAPVDEPYDWRNEL